MSIQEVLTSPSSLGSSSLSPRRALWSEDLPVSKASWGLINPEAWRNLKSSWVRGNPYSGSGASRLSGSQSPPLTVHLEGLFPRPPPSPFPSPGGPRRSLAFKGAPPGPRATQARSRQRPARAAPTHPGRGCLLRPHLPRLLGRGGGRRCSPQGLTAGSCPTHCPPTPPPSGPRGLLTPAWAPGFIRRPGAARRPRALESRPWSPPESNRVSLQGN